MTIRTNLELFLDKIAPDIYDSFKKATMPDKGLLLCINAHLLMLNCIPYDNYEIETLIESMRLESFY
jgi:hypothetical protein